MRRSPYISLYLTVGVHFIIMYALTFVAVNVLADVPVWSIRSFYMAMIMVMPMVLLMLFFMRGMYGSNVLNFILYSASAALFVLAFIFIRQQTFVGNENFLNSMIPHHSSAITMCEESSLTDPEIIALCEEIIQTQQEEINQMKEIRSRIK